MGAPPIIDGTYRQVHCAIIYNKEGEPFLQIINNATKRANNLQIPTMLMATHLSVNLGLPTRTEVFEDAEKE